MYAFAPRATKRRAAHPGSRKDPIIFASAVATIAGYLGYQGLQTIGDFLQWLFDQEAYWSTKLHEAEAAAAEARQKLDEIIEAQRVAEQNNV